jgi:hypothetical protein
VNWQAVIALLLLAVPLSARELPVPRDKGWQHAATGLILSSQLAGLTRTGLTDATESEHDVSASFQTADGSEIVTIFIFRAAIPDASLWFDRSRSLMFPQPVSHNVIAASDAPITFSANGAGSASSIRQTFDIAVGRYVSTGLAVTPVGDWILAIRISAAALTAQALDGRLLEINKAVRWPKSINDTGTAEVLAPCDKSLNFKRARNIRTSIGSVLATLAMKSASEEKENKEKSSKDAPVTWCRDGYSHPYFGVYRADQDPRSYIMALYDSGSVATIQRSMAAILLNESRSSYEVTLEDVDGAVSSFPVFGSMPDPAQVWDLVSKGVRTGTATGNTLTIGTNQR